MLGTTKPHTALPKQERSEIDKIRLTRRRGGGCQRGTHTNGTAYPLPTHEAKTGYMPYEIDVR
jgi:hypothetical protein